MTFSSPFTTKTLRLSKLPVSFSAFFQNIQDSATSGISGARKVNLRMIRNFFKKSPFIPGAIIALFVIVVVGLVVRSLTVANNSRVLSASNEEKVEVVEPKAKQTLDKSFTFSLKDEAGKEVSKFKYIVEDVQMKDEIIIRAKRYYAVKGKTFLIVNLKVRNDFDKGITINSRDFIRLVVNGSDEHIAPDIHNDPVEVQAISTEYTAVAFNIDEVNKSLVLQVGELNGKKESLPLNLQ